MTEQKEEVYSYSRLSSWHNCEKEYSLKYHDKIEDTGNWYGSAGSLVHSLIEDELKGEITKEQMKFLFYDGLNAIPHEKPYKNIYNKFVEGVDKYLDNYRGFENNGFKIVAIEEEFKIKFSKGGFWLRGFIDLHLTDSKGNHVILDHKSANNKSGKWNTKEAVKQLYLYSAYIYMKHKVFPTYLMYNFFKTNSYERIEFNRKDFDNAIKWMYDTVALIRNAESNKDYLYQAKPDDFFCNHLCGVKESCPIFEKLPMINKLKKAIEKAKPNMDKIDNVDNFIDELK